MWAPFESRAGGSQPAVRYLKLPPLDDRIRRLTDALVIGADNDFDRALQIQESLRRDGRYTDAPPPLGDGETSPIEAFILGELEGHCEYFASAMVTMARTQGLPSRLVNGFAGGVANEVGGFIKITQADAHAWVEIHFEQAGWVRFDPTPPDRRLRAAQGQSWWARVGQVGGALELWWFQRVVDFDSVDQIGAVRGLWLSWRGESASHDGRGPNTHPVSNPSWSEFFVGVNSNGTIALVLCFALGVGLWIRSHENPNHDLPRAYRDALRVLARRGLERAETDSARSFAEQVCRRISAAGGRAFQIITESYLAERFGSKPASALGAELAVLKDAVDGMRLRNQPDIG